MKFEPTARGFAMYTFEDGNGVECSVQKSSVATEDMIWLGCNDIDLKLFTPGSGWKDIQTTDNHLANTRMHLTQKQVKALLPILRRFVKTGEIHEVPHA